MLHSPNRIPSTHLVAACAAAMAVTLLCTGRVRAETPEAQPAPPGVPPAAPDVPPAPSKPVGGHIGLAVPLVTIAKETTSIGDQFTLLTPIGIGFKVSKRVAIDFETIVVTPLDPVGNTGLVVDPGVILGFDRLALGLRVAHQINALANIGLVPLVNYGLVDTGGAMWFVEGAFPITYSDHEVSLTMVLHTGVGF
jgi:hypothetical protein